MHIIKTERLTITLSKVSEAPFYFKLFNDPDWKQFINDKNLSSITETAAYLEEIQIPNLHKNGLGVFTVYLTKTNTPIGAATLIKRDFLDFIDVGYAYLPKGRGHGFATEATKEMMEYCKTAFNIKTMNAVVKPANKNSIKLLEKIGFKFVKSEEFFEGYGKDNLYSFTF